MTIDKPYFLQNSKWFFFDEDEWCYKLTKEAPEKARESYIEFYTQLE